MTDRQSIAELLRDVLAERQVSERTLAGEIGVSSNALNAWVRGTRIPEPPYVWRIAELASVPLEYAMRLAGHLPPSHDDEPTQVRAREGRLGAIVSELDDREVDLLVRLAESLHAWKQSEPDQR